MPPVSSARILVVEDEAALSMLIEDMLLDSGFEYIHPVARVSTALKALRHETYDLGILDLNIAGVPVYPVARKLEKLNIPFFFQTGYSGAGIKEPFRDRTCLQKPFGQGEFIEIIIDILINVRGLSPDK